MNGDRGAYRAFVRANHPDAGGDPATFIAGMREFREASRAGQPDRYSAPVVVVASSGGLRRVVHLVRRWWKRRGAPPRVR